MSAPDTRPPRNCFNCGQPGHLSKDCTQPRQNNGGGRGGGGGGRGGGGGDRPERAEGGAPRPSGNCFTCGRPGHLSRNCPAAGGAGPRCYNCGQSGHMSRECPAERGTCHNCQQTGHVARECPQPKAPMKCFKCAGEGHMSRECPN